MKLITKLRITALTTLAMLVYVAGKIREGESSYIRDNSDLVITVKWLNDKYYRVYLNNRDNPTHEDFFESEWNPPSSTYPELYYNENSIKSLYIIDVHRYIKKINTPNYKVQYYTSIIHRSDSTNIPALNNNPVVFKDSISISDFDERDSIANDSSNIGWWFNGGDRYIKIVKHDKLSNEIIEKPELILFDRHDDTSE